MVQVRNYKDSDYEDVKKNLQDAQLYHFECDNKENLRQKMSKDPNSILVAVVDGRAIGNIYVVAEPWCGFVFRLAVRKSYREMGIGSLLLKEAEERLKKNGIKWASVFVDDKNKELKKYYSKRGYVPAKTYKCMNKDLQTI